MILVFRYQPITYPIIGGGVKIVRIQDKFGKNSFIMCIVINILYFCIFK